MDKEVRNQSWEMAQCMVSIVVPFYDEVDYLMEAVVSAFGQTGITFEVILVCNQPELPDHLVSKHPLFLHPSVRWFTEPRKGSAYARNLGLRHARGTWIQFLDVDDLLLGDKISAQLYVSQDAGVIVSPHIYRFLNGREVKSSFNTSDIWSGLLSGTLGSTSSMLWRIASLRKISGWDLDISSSQEYELLFRLLKNNEPIVPFDRPLTIVRERSYGSITKSTWNKPLNGIQLRIQMLEYLKQRGEDTPDRRTAFQQFVFKNLRALYRISASEALALHRTLIAGTSFQPYLPAIPMYGKLYNALGFKRTENLMQLYRKLRDNWMKFLPKNE